MKRVLVCVSILWGSLSLVAGCATEEGIEDDEIIGDGRKPEDRGNLCLQVFTCARDGVSFTGEILGEVTPIEARLLCREHCGQGCLESGLSCVPQPGK